MASRSGPGQAVYDSMTLIQQRNDPAKMMSPTLVLQPSPVPWHTLRHAPLKVHWQNAALIFAYRLGRQNVEASVITTHEVTEMDNHVGPLYGLQHHSRLYILYMQHTATPMTTVHGHCILLLFSSCAAFSAACTQSATATLAHPAGSTTPE